MPGAAREAAAPASTGPVRGRRVGSLLTQQLTPHRALSGEAYARSLGSGARRVGVGIRSGISVGVRPGGQVLSVASDVRSVLVGVPGISPVILVMRRSWVRFPQAAPTFPQVNGPFRESPRFCLLPNVGQMCASLRLFKRVDALSAG